MSARLDREPTPIFLISLPRSGSTLAQRILAGHPSIATAAEPHALLPVVTALTVDVGYTKYEQHLTAYSIDEFCRHSLPNGISDYFEAVRVFALELYGRASSPGNSHFLDKTPRYHLIIDELRKIFPDGRFILLTRNPLACLASMMTTFYGRRWMTYLYYVDYFDGVANLAQSLAAGDSRVCRVRYEDMVSDPQMEARRIFEFLELPFVPAVVSEFSAVHLSGGDPNRFRPEFQSITSSSVSEWPAFFCNPLRRRWARRYLEWIGEDRLQQLGYDLSECLDQLQAVARSNDHLGSDMLRMPYGALMRTFEGHILRDKYQSLRRGRRLYMHR